MLQKLFLRVRSQKQHKRWIRDGLLGSWVDLIFVMRTLVIDSPYGVTFVLRVCGFGRIWSNGANWVDFSRSKWYLFILHAEFAQGTHGIICANIILNDSTLQIDRCELWGLHKNKSWSKSTTSPPLWEACGPGDSPSRNYNWAAWESWGREKMACGFFISCITCP